MVTHTRSRCAVCGGKIENIVRQSSGKEEYYLCSENCRAVFLESPDKFEKIWFYFRKHGVEKSTIICAVCGDKVKEDVAASQEYFDDDHLKHYFFCTEGHRIEFIKNPKKYKENSGMNISV